MLRALSRSRYRKRLGWLALGLFIVVCANTYGQIRLNAWNGSFYDTLERRSLWALGNEIVTFLVIVGGLLSLVVAQTWLQEMIKIRLREWLTHDLLDDWLAPKRAYLLSHAGEVGVNPDQRMQDDARHLAELTATLAFGLLQSSLLLVTFVGVLWGLSSQVVFALDGKSFSVPGYMVWCAIFYAAAGSWLTWLVGRPLIKLNADKCAKEADLRYALVRVHEASESIALHRGERDERRILDGPVNGVVDLGREIARGIARLTWVTSGYGWLAIIVPILVASPGYFSGAMTLGGLMMVVGAFNQVQQSLRWFVDNFPTIATWRATLLRVMTFRDGLATLAGEAEPAGRIQVLPHPAGALAFEALRLAQAEGVAEFGAGRIEIEHGERVLIVSQQPADKARLLRAVAGLSAEGEGRILLPPAETIMFMPARPYLPLTSLRATVTYPHDTVEFSDAAIRAALERTGLDHLADRLEACERWDKMLSADEQHRLALARLVLHAPDWVIFEDTTTGMSEEHCYLIRTIFAEELAHTAAIGCASSPALAGFYTRTLQLKRRGADTRPRPAPEPRRA
ncbi:MAG: ABC transporter ATP-binding protein/permease, partial [Rhodospirillaceae bacterium]|nr:ABC transporter ATP-binding protein/permease [Rhodospirillaceae bacterium]